MTACPTATGGVDVHRDGTRWRVPKRDLVGSVQVLLQARRLRLAAGLQHGPILQQELQNFQYKISELTAHESYGAWREGQHDDVLLATALACWRATRPTLAFSFF